jgi:hypothetical protein
MGVVGETSRVGLLGVGWYGTTIVESHSNGSSESSSMVVDDGMESKRVPLKEKKNATY